VTIDGTTLTVPIEGMLPDGVYTVTWRVVDAEEGHETAGAFSFGVGTASGGAAVEEVTPLGVAGGVALAVGLMLLVAIAVVGLGVFSGRPASLRLLAPAAAALGFAGAVAVLVAAQRLAGVPTNTWLASPAGRPFSWLVVATLGAAAFAVLGAARPGWRPILWLAGAAAAVALFVRTTTGHPAHTSVPLLQQTLQWIHVLSAGVWIGGTVLLLLALRADDPPSQQRMRRFWAFVSVAVALVVATGVLRALNEVGASDGVADVLRLPYGRVLALKVVVALALVGIAVIARSRIASGEPGPPTIRRIASVEVVTALGVLVLSAALTGLSPIPAALGPAPAVVPTGTVVGTDPGRTAQIELTVTPGAAGPNAFRARILDPATGAAQDADAVTLRLASVTDPTSNPTTLDLRLVDSAWVGQSTAIAEPGTWSVTAVVTRGTATFDVPLVLVTASEGQTPPPGSPFGTTTSSDGVSISLHLDPGTAGANELHVEMTGPDGMPLAPGEVIAVAIPEGAPPQRLTPVTSRARATVSIPLDLQAGSWTFDVVIWTPDGRSYQADLFGVPIAAAQPQAATSSG
jgi:copper transport protein